MTNRQLEVYHDNLLALARGIHVAGGDCMVLRHQCGFLEMLARNGIAISVLVHPNISMED